MLRDESVGLSHTVTVPLSGFRLSHDEQNSSTLSGTQAYKACHLVSVNSLREWTPTWTQRCSRARSIAYSMVEVYAQAALT